MRLPCLALLLIAPYCSAATLYSIAAGSSTDTSFSSGSKWTQPSMSALAAPYNALRSSSPPGAPFSYNLVVPPGSYTVSLRFVEPRTASSAPPVAAGQRVFSVAINGAAVMVDLDLFAQAGSLVPFDRSFPVSVASGLLAIVLTPSLGNAVISGIQVDDVPAGPVPWIPPTATFANPPANPQDGQAFVFTDVSLLRSCIGGTDVVTREICRWDAKANHWTSTGPTVASVFSMPPVSLRAVECVAGKVNVPDIPPNGDVLLVVVDGSTRWEEIGIAETVQFAGATGLTVGMGRPGTNSYEMTGVKVPLGQPDRGMWFSRPVPPQLTGSYSVVLHFEVASGKLSDITDGVIDWEACAYQGPARAAASGLVPSLRVVR